MEKFSRYLGVAGTLTVMCCIFSVVSQSDVNIISQAIGSTVTLPCKNRSLDTLSLLMWKKNGVHLFTYSSSQANVHSSPEALRLNLNMSTLESQLYAIIIEGAQDSHSGNYTCETITVQGMWEQKWKLVITAEKPEYFQTLLIVVAVVIPAVCVLFFIITWNILRKRRIENSVRPPPSGREEEIYENCLEIAANRQGHSPHCHKPRVC